MQTQDPWIYRPLKKDSSKIAVYIPWVDGFNTRQFLKDTSGGRVEWVKEARIWEMASSNLMSVAEGVARQFGKCRVHKAHNAREKCTVSCQNATKRPASECECICGGAEHGQKFSRNWHEVNGMLYAETQMFKNVDVLVSYEVECA